MIRRRLFCGMLLVLAGWPVGCQPDNKAESVCFYRADEEIGSVSRVVFVQLSESVGYPDIADRMTSALQEALLQRGLFRVDVIPLTHHDLRDLDMTKREPYTIAELSAIRQSLRCDAILFGKMIRYRPYPGAQIGLFMRLIDLKDGKLIWAVDDVWDTTSEDTYRRIQNYYFDRMRRTYDPAGGEMGIMSTDGFQRFIADEVVNTMDPNARDESSGRRYVGRPLEKLGRHEVKVTKDVIEDF